jgi:glycerate 2-kinase
LKSHRLLRNDAARIWTAALCAVDSESAVRKHVRREGQTLRIDGRRFDLGRKRIWVLGAGKAAAPMGRAIEEILGKYLEGGFLVTKYGHSLPLKKVEILEAGHPLPDRNSLVAARRIEQLARNRIEPDDLVLCLFSGGASSLLVSPAEAISLEDKVACTRALLRCGADIHELNAVRKHLSNIKGGRLSKLLGAATAISLAVSDVIGDDPATIASGPMSADPTTFAECLLIIQKLRISDQIPDSVRQHLERGAAGCIDETPKTGDPDFRESEFLIVADNGQACTAAAQAAKRLGYRAMVLTSRLDGDTAEAARFHMSIAAEIILHGRPLRPPACIISGGETTARITGEGKGGRNQEFVLHCVRQLAGLPAPCVVAGIGTDGTDGPTEAAGAIADNSTLSRSLKFGAGFLSESQENNDSYTFFKRLDDLIITGPTKTNVMDLHLVMIG